MANSPNPSFYAGDLWTCSGPGCQEWLDEAHCLLNEGTATRPPTRLTRMIGEGLIYGSRYRAVGMRIDFTSVDGGENRARLWIRLSDTFLNDSDFTSTDFAVHVGVLAHEYWHAVTYGVIPSVQAEVDAYNLETLLGIDLGIDWNTHGLGTAQPWRYDFLRYGVSLPPLTVTNNDCELCAARNILLLVYGSAYEGFPLRPHYLSYNPCANCP